MAVPIILCRLLKKFQTYFCRKYMSKILMKLPPSIFPDFHTPVAEVQNEAHYMNLVELPPMMGGGGDVVESDVTPDDLSIRVEVLDLEERSPSPILDLVEVTLMPEWKIPQFGGKRNFSTPIKSWSEEVEDSLRSGFEENSESDTVSNASDLMTDDSLLDEFYTPMGSVAGSINVKVRRPVLPPKDVSYEDY